MNKAVLKEVLDRVGILTINRPDAMNALNDDERIPEPVF